MLSFLLLVVIVQIIETIRFDCNENIQIQVPNFKFTSFFLQELYGTTPDKITAFICKGSRFSAIESGLLSSAVGLLDLDLSNNNIKTIEVNNSALSNLDLQNNMFDEYSSITTKSLSLKTLNLDGNLLTSYSKIFKENIKVTERLGLASNMIRQLYRDRFTLVSPVAPQNIALSDNLITALDEQTLEIMKNSKTLEFCPQIRDVACIEKTDNAKKMLDEILKRAGAMDVSCLAMTLPQCGEITMSKSGRNKGNPVALKVKFPDLKKVYIEEGMQLKITSPYFEPTLVGIKTSDLVLNEFSTSIPLSKDMERETTNLEIEIEEIAKGNEFIDPLNPKISSFIFKSDSDIQLQETNEYIRSKSVRYQKIESKPFKPTSELNNNKYQAVKIALIIGCVILLLLVIFLIVKFKTKRNTRFFVQKLKERNLDYMVEHKDETGEMIGLNEDEDEEDDNKKMEELK